MPKKTRRSGPKNAAPVQASGHKQDRSFRQAAKTGTIRPTFGVHPGNPAIATRTEPVFARVEWTFIPSIRAPSLSSR